MKKILTIILVLVSQLIMAQNIIYVKSKSDPRLLSYQDSLKKYLNDKAYKKAVKLRLHNCETLGEYIRVTDSLKFVPANTAVETKAGSGKYIVDDTPVYELVSHEIYGCCIPKNLYLKVVPKPKITVIYGTKPKVVPAYVEPDSCKMVNIIYTTVYNGISKVDSTKALSVNPEFTFFK